MGVWVYTDSDRMQGGDSRDGPLIVDPTQSVVILMLYCHEPGSLARHEGVLVVRTATLVGYMTSTHTGQRYTLGRLEERYYGCRSPTLWPFLRLASRPRLPCPVYAVQSGR